MAKKDLQQVLKSLLIIPVIFLYFGCSSKYEGKEEIVFLKDKDKLFKKWDELFHSHEVINFSFPDPKKELLSICGLAMNSKGEYFINDCRAKEIIQFDSKGNFVRYIGRKGEGPGEFQLPGNLFLDKEDNLFLQCVEKLSLNVYSSPNYLFLKQISLKSSCRDIIMTPEENFIIYSLYLADGVLRKYDKEGRILKKGFTPSNEKLRVFMARFQPAGLADIPGQGFLFIYSAEYAIYFYDYNLKLKKTYIPKSFSGFYPQAPDFPPELSPYEFSSEHSRWWDKFLHPGELYYLKDKFFVVELLKSEGLGGKFYVNFHDLNGNTYAKGLEVPYNGMIIYAKDDYLYVGEESKFGEDDKILPPRLHRYKLKIFR